MDRLIARIRTGRGRVFPHGPLDPVRQLALFGLAYYGYRLVRGAADGEPQLAYQNARHLIDLERGIHVFVEPAIQSWATSTHWVINFAGWMYVNAQFTVTFAMLIYIYVFHNASFYFVRNMFMVAMGIALLGYIVYPTAPPRFFPEWGFQDSVANLTGVKPSSQLGQFFNPFAAVPSMHVCFALMVGVPMARLSQWRAVKVFWGLYPVLVTFVVVATGNHFLMDAVLGALTALVSAYAAQHLFARARPAVWAFAPVAAEAPAV